MGLHFIDTIIHEQRDASGSMQHAVAHFTAYTWFHTTLLIYNVWWQHSSQGGEDLISTLEEEKYTRGQQMSSCSPETLVNISVNR